MGNAGPQAVRLNLSQLAKGADLVAWATRHIQQLSAITEYIDILPVECDGATRILHLDFLAATIPHNTMIGRVLQVGGQGVVSPHFWIEVDTHQGLAIIDYRLRMWVQDDATPHGVFLLAAHPDYQYEGEPIAFNLQGCKATKSAAYMSIDVAQLITELESK